MTLDLDLIVNIETRVFPGEELVDQFPADLLFPDQHLKDLLAEGGFQFLTCKSTGPEQSAVSLQRGTC